MATDYNPEPAQYAPPPVDPADEIEHLAQLHASAVLTDEESDGQGQGSWVITAGRMAERCRNGLMTIGREIP